VTLCIFTAKGLFLDLEMLNLYGLSKDHSFYVFLNRTGHRKVDHSYLTSLSMPSSCFLNSLPPCAITDGTHKKVFVKKTDFRSFLSCVLPAFLPEAEA